MDCTHDRFITIIVLTDGGGGKLENFHMQTFFFVSVFPQKLFFTCIQFISVFTASAYKLFQKFSPPPPIKTIMVCP